MHLTPLQGNILEKEIRDVAGRLARVTFYVYEQDGRVKARVINVVYLEESLAANVLPALPGSVPSTIVLPRTSFEHAIPSPYVSNILNTSGSKPRAPSFR